MNFNYCNLCGQKLKGTTYVRTKATSCYKCRGIKINNYEFQKACRELLKRKPTPDSVERFEDDPKAVNEIELGKVKKVSHGIIYTESSIADLIIDTKK